jgi:hypothetical protein
MLHLYLCVVQNERTRRFEINEFQVFNEETAPAESHAVEEFKFVIAYDDLSAGRRGMRVIADLARRAGGETKWRLLPWKFDILKNPVYRLLATCDAVKADLIMISTNAAHGLPPAVEVWIKSSLEQKRGDRAAVVALLGPSDHLDQPGSPRLHLVQQATEASGLDFFAPSGNHEDALESGIETSLSRTETGVELTFERCGTIIKKEERPNYACCR